MSDDVILEIPCDGSGPPTSRPPTPEEAAQLAKTAADSAAATLHATQVSTFAVSEDTERLALVSERAQVDPAFAALVDLTLGKQGVIS